MALEAWQRRLTALVDDGLADLSPEDVVSALNAAASRVPVENGPEQLRPPVPVLGVDGCPAGWVGVVLHPDGRATVHVSAGIAALVEQVRETAEVAVVGIDIPIGLPDSGSRVSDVLARKALPGKASSVFSTLTRSAYEAATYAEGRAASLATTGRSASAQAYALRAKVLEVDAWLRTRPPYDVIEVHPEVSFARMVGTPLIAKKKNPDGVARRREALVAAGITAPAWYIGQGFGEDDLLDACAVVWTAVRRTRGESVSLPEVPEVFSDGIPAAISV